MLHPGMPGVRFHRRLNNVNKVNERGIVGGRLDKEPRKALLVIESSQFYLQQHLSKQGPGRMSAHDGRYTTAASCEKDLILCSPIDEVGKKMLGKIVIVDPMKKILTISDIC